MASLLTINKQLGHSGGSSASFIVSFLPKVVRKPDAYWIEMNHYQAAKPRRNHEFPGNLSSLNIIENRCSTCSCGNSFPSRLCDLRQRKGGNVGSLWNRGIGIPVHIFI